MKQFPNGFVLLRPEIRTWLLLTCQRVIHSLVVFLRTNLLG